MSENNTPLNEIIFDFIRATKDNKPEKHNLGTRYYKDLNQEDQDMLLDESWKDDAGKRKCDCSQSKLF